MSPYGRKESDIDDQRTEKAEVLQEMKAGRMTASEAAGALELSVRQVRRLKKAHREKGAAGLVHHPQGDRGKASTRRTPEAIRKRMMALATSEYKDYERPTLHRGA